MPIEKGEKSNDTIVLRFRNLLGKYKEQTGYITKKINVHKKQIIDNNQVFAGEKIHFFNSFLPIFANEKIFL